MFNYIKQIRMYIGLSQVDMAKKIGVQFATINRWENGHSNPTRLAIERLLTLCEQLNVPAYEMIIENIKNEAKSIALDKNSIILYHGSKSGIVGDIAPISRDKCDFGKGFYMGTTPEQPLTLVCDFEKSKLYIVSIKLNGLVTFEIQKNIDWAMIVAYNRGRLQKINGSKFYNKYRTMQDGKDLAVGSIADDRMFYVLDNFFLGNVTDVALVNSLSALKLGKQYVALTNKACQAIKIEKEVDLSYFEREILKKVSKQIHQKGIDLANEACRTYRREGKFFDEILKDETKGD